ncbi:MAG TPA: DUF3311 domain-containing protein [Streptosporangiaceae bacterium]|nr:DUF3311 domain-containing protein [Streptosporangiaceae bacterium]
MAPQNSTPTPPGGSTKERGDRSDRSYWNWLLAVAVIVPLLTFVYNRTEPRLAGIPFFYWMQLAYIALGVVATVIVYQMTKKGS